MLPGALVAATIFASASAPSVAESPRGATGALQTGYPRPCSYVSRSEPAVDKTFLGGPQEEVCGSYKDDTLRVKKGGGGGTQIWAGPGHDSVDDRNGAINEIWGVTGRNTAKIDVCKGTGGVEDTVHDIATGGLTKKAVKCAGVRPSRRQPLGQRAVVYPKIEPTVECGRSAGKRWIGINDPAMRAVDATANVDFQTVAFSAILYRRASDGTWARRTQTDWLWDRTYDEQITAFPGNYWRAFKGDKRVRKFVWFEPSEIGIYQVDIHYRWYAANGLKTHNLTKTVFYHLGPFQNRDQSACDFPGPPLRDGIYSGSTDEQQRVTLEVIPMFGAPPRSTGWNLVKSFQFVTSINCTPARPASATWTIDATADFYISIYGDGTFASAHSGSLPSSGAIRNVEATYFVSGRIDQSGTASGLVSLSEISFVEGGVQYSCTGTPHTWFARAAP